MVDFIENKNGKAYVKDRLGNKAYLEVRRSSAGNKFVKTVANGREIDNLLYLLECK